METDMSQTIFCAEIDAVMVHPSDNPPVGFIFQSTLREWPRFWHDDHAVCLKAEFVAHCIFETKMAIFTQLWYIRISKGRYVFQWDRIFNEVLVFD